MPTWGWVLVVVLLVPVLLGWAFLRRFWGMCARIRAELPEFLAAEFPGVGVLGERNGDLLVRTPEGERVWEMADLYTAAARLPGLAAEREARWGVYRAAAFPQFGPRLDEAHPFSLEAHGALLEPRLARADADPEGDAATPLAEIGLCVRYGVRHREGFRLLTPGDLAAAGVSLEAVAERARANLEARWPEEALAVGGGEANALLSEGAAAVLLVVAARVRPGERVVAMIPHGDMIVMAPELDRAAAASLVDGGAMLGDPHDHAPLLDRPVEITPAGLRLLDQ